jgi:hypothetical protein
LCYQAFGSHEGPGIRATEAVSEPPREGNKHESQAMMSIIVILTAAAVFAVELAWNMRSGGS